MKSNIIKLSAFAAVFAGAALLAGCSDGDDFDYGQKGVFVTGTDTDPLVKFVVEDTPSSYAITASATKKATKDINVEFAIDTTLVSQYNQTHSSSFYATPQGSVELENADVTIAAGSALSTVAKVKVVNTENFQDGRTYVIPVTIKSISGGDGESVINSSRTVFLKVSRVLQFTSLVNESSFSSNYIFDDAKAVDLTNFTYEIKVRADQLGTAGGQIQRVCAFEEKDEKNASMLRFGENGMDGNQLQWVSPAGSVPSSTRFQNNTWYLISLVYDGSSMTMYVNGVKDATLGASGISVKFQRFELGMSWGGYNLGQFFPGRIAEVRVWNRALSPNEMVNGICGVDPKSKGLVAYWKMNEGGGNTVFKDATGNGYDMDWNKSQRDIYANGNMVETPYGGSLKWVNDENNKCAQ